MVRANRNVSRRRQTQMRDNPTIAGPLRALEQAYKEADIRKAEAYRRGILPDHPTIIDHGPLHVLLSASPTEATLPAYMNTLAAHNVTHVVRLCEPYYNASRLHAVGLHTYDWFCPDGEAPPARIVDDWLALLDAVFRLREYSRRFTSAADPVEGYESDITESPSDSPGSSHDLVKPCIAVHCAAGLGRAPVLVAIALVELGLRPMEAVGWLRALRRGAINSTQLAFLHAYSVRPPLEPPQPIRPPSRSPFTAFWPLKTPKKFRCTTTSLDRVRRKLSDSPVDSRKSVSPGVSQSTK